MAQNEKASPIHARTLDTNSPHLDGLEWFYIDQQRRIYLNDIMPYRYYLQEKYSLRTKGEHVKSEESYDDNVRRLIEDDIWDQMDD